MGKNHNSIITKGEKGLDIFNFSNEELEELKMSVVSQLKKVGLGVMWY